MKLFESLGISTEVDELAKRLINQFEKAYNDKDKWSTMNCGVQGLRCEGLMFTVHLAVYDDALNDVEFICYMFNTLEDYYKYRQQQANNFPYYNFDEKKIYIPVICAKDKLPFKKIKNDILSILSHELMHAYQSSKLKKSLGNELYVKALGKMGEHKNSDIEYGLSQVIYFSSLFEIDAQAHNLYTELNQSYPKDYNEVKKVKTYTWLEIIKRMYNDVMQHSETERFKKCLSDFGMDVDDLAKMVEMGNKYRQRKFDRIMHLYLYEKENVYQYLLHNSDGPIEMGEEMERRRKYLNEQINYLIDSIL